MLFIFQNAVTKCIKSLNFQTAIVQKLQEQGHSDFGHAYLTEDFLNKLRDQCNQKYSLNLHGKTHRNVAVVGTY